MTIQTRPILYSFRRCPYAMRARMAIKVANLNCELREIVLRDKPEEMLALSPKATVPVLLRPDGSVLDESFDIMQWALAQNDPDGWRQPERGNEAEMLALIARIEGPFKRHLDRYKYANRYAEENEGVGVDPVEQRDAAMEILKALDERLQTSRYLFGDRLSLADAATAPFVRQYANTGLSWFSDQPIPELQKWLARILESDLFLDIMHKYPPWKSGDPTVSFPPLAEADHR